MVLLEVGVLIVDVQRRSNSFGDDARPTSAVSGSLLLHSIPEREGGAARAFYRGLSDKACVWTEQPLGQRFDVDHAIPFSLWGNNDLWNLLPAAPGVNNEKRDCLPTHEILRRQRDRMIGYWSLIREAHPIPENSICLFRAGEALAGTRQGRIVLVALRDTVDPEAGAG